MHGFAGAEQRWVRWVAVVSQQLLSHLHLVRICDSTELPINAHMNCSPWQGDAGQGGQPSSCHLEVSCGRLGATARLAHAPGLVKGGELLSLDSTLRWGLGKCMTVQLLIQQAHVQGICGWKTLGKVAAQQLSHVGQRPGGGATTELLFHADMHKWLWQETNRQ